MSDYEFDVDRFENAMRERKARRTAELNARRKRKRIQNRRIVTLVLSFVMLVTVSAFIDAYMSDAERADNEFSIGGSNIDIVEEFDQIVYVSDIETYDNYCNILAFYVP